MARKAKQPETPNPLPCGCKAEIDNWNEADGELVSVDVSVHHCPLHAAAGDLLRACKQLLAISLPHDVSGQRMRDEALAAIAKAEVANSFPKGP